MQESTVSYRIFGNSSARDLCLLESALAQLQTMFATEMFGRPRTKKEALIAGSLQPGIELSLFLGAAFRAVFSIKLILLGFCSEFAIKVFGRFPSADLKKTLMVFSWLIAKKMFELLEKAAIGLMPPSQSFHL